MGANVEGKPQTPVMYFGGLFPYLPELERSAQAGFPELLMRKTRTP